MTPGDEGGGSAPLQTKKRRLFRKSHRLSNQPASTKSSSLLIKSRRPRVHSSITELVSNAEKLIVLRNTVRTAQ